MHRLKVKLKLAAATWTQNFCFNLSSWIWSRKTIGSDHRLLKPKSWLRLSACWLKELSSQERSVMPGNLSLRRIFRTTRRKEAKRILQKSIWTPDQTWVLGEFSKSIWWTHIVDPTSHSALSSACPTLPLQVLAALGRRWTKFVQQIMKRYIILWGKDI